MDEDSGGHARRASSGAPLRGCACASGSCADALICACRGHGVRCTPAACACLALLPQDAHGAPACANLPSCACKLGDCSTNRCGCSKSGVGCRTGHCRCDPRRCKNAEGSRALQERGKQLQQRAAQGRGPVPMVEDEDEDPAGSPSSTAAPYSTAGRTTTTTTTTVFSDNRQVVNVFNFAPFPPAGAAVPPGFPSAPHALPQTSHAHAAGALLPARVPAEQHPLLVAGNPPPLLLVSAAPETDFSGAAGAAGAAAAAAAALPIADASVSGDPSPAAGALASVAAACASGFLRDLDARLRGGRAHLEPLFLPLAQLTLHDDDGGGGAVQQCLREPGEIAAALEERCSAVSFAGFAAHPAAVEASGALSKVRVETEGVRHAGAEQATHVRLVATLVRTRPPTAGGAGDDGDVWMVEDVMLAVRRR